METARRIIRGGLLLFVAVSVGFAIYQEVGPTGATPVSVDSPPAASVSAAPDAAPDTDAGHAGTQIIAYYFHNTRRCATCLKIEAAAESALRIRFAEDLETGRLVWEPVCMEEPQHDHFIDEFKLTSPSLVAARIEGDRVTDWALLDRTWALVRDPEPFDDYVIGVFDRFLEGVQ